MDRIISKEEEREDIQGEILQSSSRTVVFHTESIHFYMQSNSVSTCNPATAKTTILCTELILPQEISKKYYNYKAHPMQIITRHLPVTVPHASKHSTWQNKAPGSPTAFKAHTAQAGFQLIATWQKQHSKRQPASTETLQDTPGTFLQNSTRRIRILSKRAKYCIIYAILRSVCSKLLILALRIILQEY